MDAPADTVPASFTPPTVAPAPAPFSAFGFVRAFVRNPLATIPREAYEQPIVVRDNERAWRTIWIMDPALIERVLLDDADNFPKTRLERRVFEDTLGDGILTSQGASWRWQRRTAAPLFRPADLAALVPAMSAEGAAQLEAWRLAPPGSVRPIDHDMSATTFRVISETMFAGSGREDMDAFRREIDRSLRWAPWEIAAGIVGVPKWVWHPGKWPRSTAARRLRTSVATLLDRRLEAGIEADHDLLARLAAARDPETGNPMARAQLIDNLLTFLAAGHETTAKALTWSLFLIARAPEWQARIRAEVALVAGRGPITAQHLDRLIVTRQVLKEAMRVYPPVAVMSRVAGAATSLGGVDVPKHTNVVIPIYAVHRHRRLWTDPDAFDPARFSPDAEKSHARAQFMPFGFGPRLCIGMTFAMMEGVALLATLVRGARFDWPGGAEPEPVSRITLTPRHGMPLAVTPLPDAPEGPSPRARAA